MGTIREPARNLGTVDRRILGTFRPSLASGSLVFASGLLVHMACLAAIERFTSSYPSMHDVLMARLPYVDFGWPGELYFYVFVAAVALVHARMQRPTMAGVFAQLGIFYAVRGLFLFFMPIGSPADAPALAQRFTLYPFPSHAYFPGGHMGFMTIVSLSVRDPRWRRAFLAATVLFAFGTIMARTHYTADALGGWLLAYAVRSWSRRHIVPRTAPLAGRAGGRALPGTSTGALPDLRRSVSVLFVVLALVVGRPGPCAADGLRAGAGFSLGGVIGPGDTGSLAGSGFHYGLHTVLFPPKSRVGLRVEAASSAHEVKSTPTEGVLLWWPVSMTLHTSHTISWIGAGPVVRFPGPTATSAYVLLGRATVAMVTDGGSVNLREVGPESSSTPVVVAGGTASLPVPGRPGFTLDFGLQVLKGGSCAFFARPPIVSDGAGWYDMRKTTGGLSTITLRVGLARIWG